jgi:hypothetical protein
MNYPFDKMDPEAKRLWVDALRSGKYPQGFDALLKNKNGYCCLGVLSEIYPGALNKEVLLVNETCKFGDEVSLLPSEVARWAGFSTDNPVIAKTDNSLICASTANDILKMTFEEIADAIEENL